MKKAFVKPSLKSYALNKKENIVASVTWNDGTMTTHWKFHQYDADHQLITHADGCFDMLDYNLATTENRLAHEGSWNAWVAILSRYDDPESDDYGTDAAKQDWLFYTACRNTGL